MTGLGYTPSEPLREDSETPDPRLVKCMRCSGTGIPGPKRPGAQPGVCPACEGEGRVPETHAWAGYEWSLDFRGNG